MRAPDGYVCAIDHVNNRVQVARSVGGLPGPWEHMAAFEPCDPVYGPINCCGSPVWRKTWEGKRQAMKNKCTCGTQIVGGLCSSWCDLVRPAEAEEPEPDTERPDTRLTGVTLGPFDPVKTQAMVDAWLKTYGKLAPPKT